MGSALRKLCIVEPLPLQLNEPPATSSAGREYRLVRPVNFNFPGGGGGGEWTCWSTVHSRRWGIGKRFIPTRGRRRHVGAVWAMRGGPRATLSEHSAAELMAAGLKLYM